MECLGIVMPIYGHAYHYVGLLFTYTGSQTVEQIKKNLWSFMRLVNIN